MVYVLLSIHTHTNMTKHTQPTDNQALKVLNTFISDLDLHQFETIIINSSAGKDSLCSIFELCRMADEQNYDKKRMVVSHQDLGEAEWGGTFELAQEQAELFGLDFFTSKRVNKDGHEESLLEYVERRGMWPSSQQRWCTSDFKRDPGAKVLRKLTKDMEAGNVLYVFGFRREESKSRSLKPTASINKRLTTKTRTVIDFHPILEWKLDQVWKTIKGNNLPYHIAYDLGMPRLSCTFCVFAGFDALVVAGIHNPEKLDKYIAVEEKINFNFKNDHSLKDVKNAIENGYVPERIKTWNQ